MLQPDFKTSALFTGSTGEEAEVFVCRELERHHHRVLERNLHSPFGEIDIIAEIENTICFIEVKYRSNSDHGDPAEFVTPAKQRRIYKTALWWVTEHPELTTLDPPLSFDIAAITGNTLNYLHNAYDVPSA